MSDVQIRMAVLSARIEACHVGRPFSYVSMKPRLSLKGGAK